MNATYSGINVNNLVEDFVFALIAVDLIDILKKRKAASH